MSEPFVCVCNMWHIVDLLDLPHKIFLFLFIKLDVQYMQNHIHTRYYTSFRTIEDRNISDIKLLINLKLSKLNQITYMVRYILYVVVISSLMLTMCILYI